MSFCFDILQSGRSIADLRWKYRGFLAEALHRSPETLEQAASEWEAFVDEFFRDQGRVVPDWPQHVKIQEGFGIWTLAETQKEGTEVVDRVMRQNVSKREERAEKWIWSSVKGVCIVRYRLLRKICPTLSRSFASSQY